MIGWESAGPLINPEWRWMGEPRCIVSSQSLEEARTLAKAQEHVKCAAVLLRAKSQYDASVETSARDGTKVLEASLRALSLDSYLCLGVARDASGADVKRAYHALAREYHPDKNGGATGELFATITASYRELASRSERSEPKPTKAQQDEEWERMFWEMAQFKVQRGHCYVPCKKKDDLGSWGYEQRVANEAGELSDARRARLEAIGFNIDDVEWRRRMLSPPAPLQRTRSEPLQRTRSKRSSRKKNKKEPPSPSTSGDSSTGHWFTPTGSPSAFFCTNLDEQAEEDKFADDDDVWSSTTSSSSVGCFASGGSRPSSSKKKQFEEASTFEIAIFGYTLVRVASVTTSSVAAPPRRPLRRTSKRR